MIIARAFERTIVKHSPFDSSEPELDIWLKEQSGQLDRRNGARTLLGLDEARTRVAGYYTTVTYKLRPDEVAPISRLRTWLGLDPDGWPHFPRPERHDDYRLSAAVRADWDDIRDLAAAGLASDPPDPDLLEKALDRV
ncbi:hypothetical protein Q6348_01920 [Isoptericola sp. b441]|uniref:Uncharacterized protein n=1 Tax=Actinotalea lenta TaxID=3064654 RepID=A0ABT9D5A5_9CELL|nr:hypothetical protein [Isoptericola sp. b441]MDO8105950.1 hypothetical protein [Isoptericola sp. b441]